MPLPEQVARGRWTVLRWRPLLVEGRALDRLELGDGLVLDARPAAVLLPGPARMTFRAENDNARE